MRSVGGPRVGEDLLVLLEPGVHGLPLEADMVPELLDGGVGIAHGGIAGLGVTHPHRQVFGVAPAGRVADLACWHQFGDDVGRGEVVGRVVGHLPDQQRSDGVGHEVAPEVGADPLGAPLDPNPSSRAISHGPRNPIRDRGIPLVLYPLPVDRRPGRPELREPRPRAGRRRRIDQAPYRVVIEAFEDGV